MKPPATAVINFAIVISVLFVLGTLNSCSQLTIEYASDLPTTVSQDGYTLTISAADYGALGMPAPSVTFSIPEDSHVRLVLLNATGYEVIVLVNEFRSAGTYTENYVLANEDGEPVKTGIYFLELLAGAHYDLKLQYVVR